MLFNSWTPEQDALLRKLYKDTPKEDLEKKIGKTWHEIRIRAAKFYIKRDDGLKAIERRRSMNMAVDKNLDKEISLLKAIFENNNRVFIKKEFDKIGSTRTWQSIKALAKALKLKPKEDPRKNKHPIFG